MSEMEPDGATKAAGARLFEKLSALGIAVAVVPYPAHKTVEEGKALRGAMTGTFTKNLLLKDKRGQMFLLSLHEDRELNMKVLPAMLGAKGHLSFASGERMHEVLGVIPGALTPMALVNDLGGAVIPVIDSYLMSRPQLNFHPLTSTESIGLSPSDLTKFIRSCGHDPVIVDLDVDGMNGAGI